MPIRTDSDPQLRQDSNDNDGRKRRSSDIDDDDDGDNELRVTLPIATASNGGAPDAGSSSPRKQSSQKDNVTVGVRVRSFTSTEPRELAIRMAGSTCQITSEERGSQRFTFDHCFWSNDVADDGIGFSSQQDVYETIGAPLVANLAQGYNCCLIAYGPTGSGKTYSLFGSQENNKSGATSGVNVHEGVVPRVLRQMFSVMGQDRVESVTCTAVEIYLENVYDLLDDARRELQVKPDLNKKTFYIAGAAEREVRNFDDVRDMLVQVDQRKTVQATSKNIQSSRAHTIIQTKLTLREPRQVVSLAFADLAGSERIKETQSEGITRDQAKHINLSLMSLGKCVEATAKAGRQGDGSSAADILHFKDSALTKVLKEYIAGNTLTTLLVTVAPGSKDFHHTMQALRFGDRAKHIKHHATIQTTLEEAVVAQNVLHDVGQVGSSDMGLGGVGEGGGRLYLFRHTKDYITAQFQIRVLSMQKREQHLRASYLVEEEQAFKSLIRFIRRDHAREVARIAKLEIKKLPVLMRLRKAMAITEPSTAEPSSSAPPILNTGEKRTRLPPLPRAALGVNPAPRALSQEPPRSTTKLPDITSPRSGAKTSRAPPAAEGETPRGPAQPVLRSLSGGPITPPPPPAGAAKNRGREAFHRRARAADDDAAEDSTTLVVPTSVVAVTTPRRTTGQSHSTSPGASNRSPAKGPVIVNAANQRAAAAARASAERQFNSNEFMQRLLIETEEATARKKWLKEVEATIPDHGNEARLEGEEARKSSRALLSRRQSSVVSPLPPPTPQQSVSPDEAPIEVTSADPRHYIGIPVTTSRTTSFAGSEASTATDKSRTPQRQASAKVRGSVSGASTPASSSASPVAARRTPTSSVASPSPKRSPSKAGSTAAAVQRERQLTGEEYMQRVVLEAEAHASWKTLMKSVQHAVPEHGVTSKVSAEDEARKTTRALLSRRHSSLVAVSPTPPRSTRDAVSPIPPVQSPSYNDVPHSIIVSVDATSPFSGSDNSNSADGWMMGRGSRPHEVQPRKTSSDPIPAPPSAAKPRDQTPRRLLLSPSSLSQPEPSDCAELAEHESTRRKNRLEHDEQAQFKNIIIMAAIDAGSLLLKLPRHAVSQHQNALSPVHRSLLVREARKMMDAVDSKKHWDWLTRCQAQDSTKNNTSEASSSAPVSWAWLVMMLEFASFMMLLGEEDSFWRFLAAQAPVTPPQKTKGSKTKSVAQTSSLASDVDLVPFAHTSFRADCAALQHRIHRALVLLRGVDTAPDTALEASLDPNEVRVSGILLTAGSLLKSASSLSDVFSAARSRQRKVSFSEGTANHLHHNTDRDIVDEDDESAAEEVTPTPPKAAVALERAISPVESTPSNSSLRSTPSSSPRSTPRSSPPSTPRSLTDSPHLMSPPSKLEITAGPEGLFEQQDPQSLPEYVTPPLSKPTAPRQPYYMLDDVKRIQDSKSSITRQNSRGTFTDEDHRKVAKDHDAIGSIKKTMIDRISSQDRNIVLSAQANIAEDSEEATDLVTAFHEFFEDLILSTDIDRLNLLLVRCMIDAWRQRRVYLHCNASSASDQVDLIAVCESKGLIAAACTDGSLEYLRSLLNLYRAPPASSGGDAPYAGNVDMNEISSCAMFHQLQRIPLVHVLLTYVLQHRSIYPSLHRAFVDGVQDLAHEWNEFLSDICCQKKLLPKESKEQKQALVALMLQTASASPTDMPLDMLDEGADDNTRLSRIAKDGDTALLATHQTCLPSPVFQELMLHHNPDNTTVLIQAVLGGQKAMVASLCESLRSIASTSSAAKNAVRELVQLRCEEGSALDLCKLLRRDSAIQASIEGLLSRLA